MPPLKMDMASPRLQIAWPGIGYGQWSTVSESISVAVRRASKLALMYCHSVVPGTMTCKPPRRLCRNDCHMG